METIRTTSLRKPRFDRCLCIVILLLILGVRDSYAQGVGISEISITPVGTAILELRSTLRGFLPPRLTTTERNAIVSPATGLLIYNSTTNNLNFYDGTTWTTTSALDQSITPTWTGAHTWSALGTFNLGLNASGAAVNINASSNFATNINTGTSTGAIAIGNTASTGITEQVGTGNYALNGTTGSTYSIGSSTTTGTMTIGGTAQTGAITVGSSSAAQTLNLGTGAGAATVNVANGLAGSAVSIANGGNTSPQTINIGAGASAANNTINIGSGTNTVGVTAVAVGSNTNLANTTAIRGGNGATAITLTPQATGAIVIGDAAGTGAITVGSSSAAQTVNVGTGAGAATVNVANGLAGSAVSIANGANTSPQTINIGAGASAANNTINIGSGTNTAGVTAVAVGSNTNLANTTAIRGGNGATAISLTPQTTGAIVIGDAAGTGAITVGSSSAAQTVNVGTGAGAATVNIATGATNAKAVNIGTGAIANTILIGNTTAGTVTGINVASSTAQLHLGAGTATASQGAPLKLTTGTNLTAAEAGAVEYDGKVFYNTAVASTRQVATTQQFISNTANFTMTFNAAGQSVFATANDEINVAASTSYFFEGYYSITGMGATTRTTATLFAGTATFTSIAYYAMIQTGAANALAAVQSTKNCVTATGNVLNATVATAAAVITVKGIMRINAGGTIIPQVDFSANPGGIILGMANSWFRIWPIGTDAVAAVGNVN